MTTASRLILWQKHKNQNICDSAVFWFDGIMNAGKNELHASSTNTWVNLGTAGTTYNALRNKNLPSTLSLWTSNAALFTSRTSIYQWFCIGNNNSYALNMLGDSYTIGCTFAVQAGWRSNYSGILGSHAKWNDGINVGLVFGQYENGNIGIGSIYKSNDSPGAWLNYAGIYASDFTNGVVANMIFMCNPSRRAVFVNGILKNELISQAASNKITLTNDFHIGNAYTTASASSSDRTFVGNIYDVYAWNKALDDITVKQIAEYSLNRFI